MIANSVKIADHSESFQSKFLLDHEMFFMISMIVEDYKMELADPNQKFSGFHKPRFKFNTLRSLNEDYELNFATECTYLLFLYFLDKSSNL
jgi:hypothetical protein